MTFDEVAFSGYLLLSSTARRIHDRLDARKGVTYQANRNAMGIIERCCIRNLATFEGVTRYIHAIVAVPQPFFPVSDQDAVPGFSTLDDLIS